MVVRGVVCFIWFGLVVVAVAQVSQAVVGDGACFIAGFGEDGWRCAVGVR